MNRFLEVFKKPSDSRLFYFVFCFLIAGFSTYWISKFLTDFSDPSGANGYFYLKQTETLATKSEFYFKDRSLVFVLLVGWFQLVKSSLLAFQLSVATTWGLSVLGASALSWSVGTGQSIRTRGMCMILATGSLACTTQYYEFCLVYLKNSFAVMLAVWALAVTFSQISSRVKLSLGLFIGAASFLSHKSMLIVFLCFGAPVCIHQMKNLRVRVIRIQTLIIGTFVSFAVIVAGTTAYLMFFEKSLAHFKAMGAYFSSPDIWYIWFENLRYHNLEMQITLVMLLVFIMIFLVARRNLTTKARVICDGTVLITAIALLPFQLPGPNGAFYRILLMAPIFVLPCLAPVVLALSNVHYPKAKWWAIVILVAFFLPYFAQPMITTRHLDDVITPFSLLEKDVRSIRRFVTPDDHLTSHHGLEFYIDYITGIRSRSFLATDPSKRNFRVAYVDESWLRSDVGEELKKAALLTIGTEYALLSEQDWLRMTVKHNVPRHWKNPSEIRPAFISE